MKLSPFKYRLLRFLPALSILLMVGQGCIGKLFREEPFAPAAVSLLTLKPYYGNETEIRQPEPQPDWIQFNGELSEGWFVPVEKILRFPVEIKPNSNLSFRLAINQNHPPHRPASQVSTGQTEPLTVPPPLSLQPGDLALRIEYVPQSQTPGGSSNPIPVLTVADSDISGAVSEWTPLEVSLNNCPVGSGELNFIAEGTRAGDSQISVMWGSPAIYQKTSRRHYNVLLIGVDTLRFDALTPNGARSDLTPNLENFSKEATNFKQNRSQAPWTLPSFASMVSGRWPGQTLDTRFIIRKNVETIGQRMLSQGFATFTVCGSPQVGNNTIGFNRGMESFQFIQETKAQSQAQRAMEFISSAKDRDWFCFLHVMDPHSPYQPPVDLAEKFGEPGYNSFYKTVYPGPGPGFPEGSTAPPETEIRQVHDLYEAEVANVDAAIGDVMAFLKSNGLLDQTLVIFVADHGEEFFEHGQFTHGFSQYDTLIHVPLIVRGKGFPAGREIDTPVANVDIVPSILQYLGNPIPESLPGIPLQTTIEGQADPGRIILSHQTMSPRLTIGRTGRGLVAPSDDLRITSATQWPFKCIVNLFGKNPMMFDLSSDPGENTDIASQNPDLVGRLTARLFESYLYGVPSLHVWFTNDFGTPHIFTGTIKIPGGIARIDASDLSGTDQYTATNDSITFSISNTQGPAPANPLWSPLGYGFPAMPLKSLVIYPAPGASTVEANVLLDGEVATDNFFPYGSLRAEPSDSAVVPFADYPMQPTEPRVMGGKPASMFLWATVGALQGSESDLEADPQLVEQLRSLGYLGGN